MPVRVDAADEHAVFLNEAEAGRGFARAGQGGGIARGAEEGEHGGGSGERLVGVLSERGNGGLERGGAKQEDS